MATHWGYYWSKKKHVKRTLCSDLPRIDSFVLYPNDQKTGFKIEALDIEAEAFETHLKLSYGKRKTKDILISIERQNCQYGGYRSFFRCNLCNNRVRFLYLGQNSLFLCRNCWNASYKTQILRPSKRYNYIAQKLKTRLKVTDSEGFACKLKGMHQSTYEKLQNKIFEYERKSHNADVKEAVMYYGEGIRAFLEPEY